MKPNTRPELAAAPEKLAASGHVEVIIETESGDTLPEQLTVAPEATESAHPAFAAHTPTEPPRHITDAPFHLPDLPAAEIHLLAPEPEVAASAGPPPRAPIRNTATPAGRIERSLVRRAA